MKKPLHLVLIFLCPLFAFSNGFVLSGNIAGIQSGHVSLIYKNASGDDSTISAAITAGRFILSGKVPEPELVRLTITETGWQSNFFLENSSISFTKDAEGHTTIKGSAQNTVYEKLKPGLNSFFENARQSNNALWRTQQLQWIQTIRSSIASNHDNYAALYFIQWLLFKPDNIDSIYAVFMQLSPTVREGIAGRKFLTDFDHLHRSYPGQKAPEVLGTDTSGKPIKLASYAGKVILLDFWASFCGPCRQENKRMISIYEKYHTAGFEIVSFSMDDQRAIWLNAIHADGMPWPQLSELRGGASATAGTYDITDLPRNVLIDQNGKIYAKDLHGDDLTGAIEKLLSHK